MRPRTLLGLIICNLVWSAHPAMGKLVLADFGPVYGAWLRYATALASYVVAVLALRGRVPAPFVVPSEKRDWVMISALGFLTFCFSPLLQMAGLDSSRATDNALIIALEPLMTVGMARLALGEKLSPALFACFALAIAGFGLLTGNAELAWDPRLAGNLLMLVALSGEASYSTLGRKLTERHAPMGVFGTALALGVVFLTLATATYGFITGAPVGLPSARSLLGLLWLGPLGTAATYLFWMLVLGEATVASLAITLFIQPVFGSFWGHFFLGERLTSLQAVGGALIILAVALQTLVTFGVKK